MYDHLSRFKFGLKENTGEEPSGEPATVVGHPVNPSERKNERKGGKRYEDVATDILTKIGSDEAKREGHKIGSARHFEYVREFVKSRMEKMKEDGMEPGEPAADPNSPDATTTNKELGERRGGKKREGDDDDKPPAFIQAKIDAKKDAEKDEARKGGKKREDGEDEPDPDDDEEPEDESRLRAKTEAMIEAVVQGKDPHRIVEGLFRR
jgi:hypothetical protein